jgi:hypothetical protein
MRQKKGAPYIYIQGGNSVRRSLMIVAQQRVRRIYSVRAIPQKQQQQKNMGVLFLQGRVRRGGGCVPSRVVFGDTGNEGL